VEEVYDTINVEAPPEAEPVYPYPPIVLMMMRRRVEVDLKPNVTFVSKKCM
jgi:hypothetical protein